MMVIDHELRAAIARELDDIDAQAAERNITVTNEMRAGYAAKVAREVLGARIGAALLSMDARGLS